VVQELMGGRFGEMSTFLNYTFQSFNFRGRQGARPFYDLVANIAAEEFGHIELVATAINTMLTGASPTSNGRKADATKSPLASVKGLGNPQHFVAGGQVRYRRTRTAVRGTATTSSPRVTWSRT
jgi:manganese catalase